MHPEAAPLSRKVLWAFLVAVLVGLAVAAVVRRGTRSLAEQLPVYGEVPEFSLTNRTGALLTREHLRGRPWIADFIFTSCQVSCPILTDRMAKLARQLSPEEARFVSITVDPTTDTPEVLDAYARDHGAGEHWAFLTGPPDEVFRLIRTGFQLGVSAAPQGAAVDPGEPITHSTRFVLVDAGGRIRGYYDAFDAAALDKLTADLASLGS